MLDMPYFMQDPEWYYFDGKKFVLTEKAPEEAKKSLKEYYKDEEKMLYGMKNGS